MNTPQALTMNSLILAKQTSSSPVKKWNGRKLDYNEEVEIVDQAFQTPFFQNKNQIFVPLPPQRNNRETLIVVSNNINLSCQRKINFEDEI